MSEADSLLEKAMFLRVYGENCKSYPTATWEQWETETRAYLQGVFNKVILEATDE